MIRGARVFISYSHDSADHMKRVLDFSNWLRSLGVESRIDQYEVFPPQGWPAWCENEMESADHILVVCTAVYKDRFSGRQPTDVSLGVVWEAGAILDFLYQSGGSGQSKVVPIVFNVSDTRHIPERIRRYSYFDVSLPQRREALFRFITGQSSAVSASPGSPFNPSPRSRWDRQRSQQEPSIAQPHSGAKKSKGRLRPGERVRISLPAGHIDPEASGLPFKLWADKGRTGRIISLDRRIALVEWEPQDWSRTRLMVGKGDKVRLGSFTTTINLDWLKREK